MAPQACRQTRPHVAVHVLQYRVQVSQHGYRPSVRRRVRGDTRGLVRLDQRLVERCALVDIKHARRSAGCSARAQKQLQTSKDDGDALRKWFNDLGAALPVDVWTRLVHVGVLFGASMLLWEKARQLEEGSTPKAYAEWQWWVEALSSLR